MKVSVTITFTPEDRRLVSQFLGRTDLATHIECVQWARQAMCGNLAVLAIEMARRKQLQTMSGPLPPLTTRGQGGHS